MNTNIIIAIIIFLVLIVVSRYFSEKGLKSLTDEQKSALIDEFSKMRIFVLIPIITLVGLYFLILKYFRQHYFIATIVYFVAIIAYLIGNNIFIYFKLKKLDLSDEYRKQYIIAQSLRYIGIVIFLFVLVKDIFKF